MGRTFRRSSAEAPRFSLCGSMPRTVRHSMRLGARKWMGPFFGLVFVRLLRKDRNLSLLRTTARDCRGRRQPGT